MELGSGRFRHLCDLLRANGVATFVDLPQICVVGDQSSGSGPRLFVKNTS